ncbi:TPA: hypothetical protein ACHYWP_004604, partial [Escherichia coli]
MEDWRTKPRTGASQFAGYEEEIRLLKEKKYTNKQIYDAISQKGITIGQKMFYIYMRRMFNDELYIKPSASKNKKEKTVLSDNIIKETTAWNNVNIRSLRLIKDLESYGLTPEIVREWREPNEMAVRQHLTVLISKKG